MKLRLLPNFLLVMLLIAEVQVKAQDPYFSQIESTMPYQHPAWIDKNNCIDCLVAHRSQWYGSEKGYATNFISLNPQFTDFNNVNIGFSFMDDKEGIGSLHTGHAQLNIRILKRLTRIRRESIYNNISFALAPGFTWKNLINPEAFIFSGDLDPQFGAIGATPSNFTTRVFFDPAFGVTAKTTHLHINASVHHLIPRWESLTNGSSVAITRRYVVTINADRFILNPIAQLLYQEGNNSSRLTKLTIGPSFSISLPNNTDKINLAAYYSCHYGSPSANNANGFVLVGSTKFKVSEDRSYFEFGISYDVFRNIPLPTTELTIKYHLRCRTERRTCPAYSETWKNQMKRWRLNQVL